jgi:hypothetical protein
MPETILDNMDSWKRLAGTAADDGSFTPFVQDKAALILLQQLVATMGQVLAAVQAVSVDTKDAVTKLAGIRARLEGGIKTQAGTIAVNV